VVEHGFVGGYDSVKRFVQKLGATAPVPFRRRECELGHDATATIAPSAAVVLARGAEWAATGKVTLPVPKGLSAASEGK